MANSKPSAARRAEVERIVREVLAEVLSKCGSQNNNTGTDELMVTEKIVSAKEIERRLEGIMRLVVIRGAIITPAARDLLKERKISIATAVGH
jgi:hypothetical protein